VKSGVCNNGLLLIFVVDSGSSKTESQKPVKAVIRHLPINTPAQDISEGLENLGFDVVSVKQMTTTRRSQTEEAITRNLHL
jgi:hypothetical protein